MQLTRPGSTAEASAQARVAIETVVRQYGIRTMLDSPCGSFSWMPLIDFEALNVTYVTGGNVSYTPWNALCVVLTIYIYFSGKKINS